MQFGFIDDSPATGSADAAIEWATQVIAQCRIGTGMLGGWAGMGIQYAVYDFTDELLREREDVLIGGFLVEGFGHCAAFPMSKLRGNMLPDQSL
jgi:hypothetical protein